MESDVTQKPTGIVNRHHERIKLVRLGFDFTKNPKLISVV